MDRNTAGYRTILGDVPKCGPGDLDAAKRYLARIERALEHGGWTRSERNRLYRLRDKWQARADGKDPRYNVVGTRGGRLSPDEEIRIRDINARLSIEREIEKAVRARPQPALPDALGFENYGVDDFRLQRRRNAGPEGFAKGGPSRDIVSEEDPAYDDDISDPEDFAGGRGFTLYKRPVLHDKYFFVAASDGKGGKARLQCTIQPMFSRAIEEIVRSKRYGAMRTHGDFFRWAVARAVEHCQNMQPNPKLESFLRQAWLIDELMLDEISQQTTGDLIERMSKALDSFRGTQGGEAKARNLAMAVKTHIDMMPDGYWKASFLQKWKEVCGYLLDGKRNEGVSLDTFTKG